jgi:hypothetical protein
MTNLSWIELKKELNKYVHKMADELVFELKEKRISNKYINKEKLCIR